MSGGFSDILRSLEEKDARKLERKVPSWSGASVEIPQSINFQQCSGEIAARYKASLVAPGARVADLTGGLGVDSWAFSQVASAVWYNERDAVLRDAVGRNFATLGVSNVAFNCFDISPDASDWLDALKAFAPDVIYLDPARRDASGRKVFLLEDCSPDVLALMPLLLSLAPVVMVKVSPVADITMLRRRLQGYLSEIHVVGADSECKELLCLCRRPGSIGQLCLRPILALTNMRTEAQLAEAPVVLFENGYVFAAQKKILQTSASLHPSHCASLVGPSRSSGHGRPLFAEFSSASATTYPINNEPLLFVPSAAMVKAGMGPGMCLMPFSEPLSHFGRFWQVIENLPFAASEIKTLRRRYPQADVTARGVPITSDQLRSKLHVTPGGPVHIFACSLASSRRLLICTPYNPPIVP
jgi:hypothetical protein